MPAASPTPSASILGLALTLDPGAPALAQTLSALRNHSGMTLDTPSLPFVAAVLETTDPRRDHSWLESLPGVTAVDVVFVEVLPEEKSDARPHRRRSRDPIDDALLPVSA